MAMLKLLIIIVNSRKYLKLRAYSMKSIFLYCVALDCLLEENHDYFFCILENAFPALVFNYKFLRNQNCRVLTCVRMPLLKPHFITDHVASHPFIRECLDCRDLIDEAKDYHLMPERRKFLKKFR